MKKVMFLLFTLLIVVTLSSCSESQGNAQKEAEGTAAENPIMQETVDETEPAVKEEEDKEDKEETDEGFLVYRPEVGAKKTFTEDGETLFSEEVIAANDEFVQIAIDLGGNKTVQIYRWTKEEISLVLEEREELDPYQNQLDSFTPMDDPDVFISSNGNTDWELLETGVEVEVPYGKVKDVYVFQKVTDEVEGADTIYTKYFAPSLGLVKDSFELTGEGGYKGESSLETVE